MKYLHYLQQEETYLLFIFLDSQKRNRTQGDWVSKLINVKKHINFTLLNKREFQKNKFKKVKEYAFEQLTIIQKYSKKSKG